MHACKKKLLFFIKTEPVRFYPGVTSMGGLALFPILKLLQAGFTYQALGDYKHLEVSKVAVSEFFEDQPIEARVLGRGLARPITDRFFAPFQATLFFCARRSYFIAASSLTVQLAVFCG
jgi:hypothetical protein